MPTSNELHIPPLRVLELESYRPTRFCVVETLKFVYWQEEDAWLGYLQDYPDYWTQGESLDDLKEHLRDLYKDVTSGELPGVRKVGELALP